jgi:hypothetical protein
MEFCTLSTEQSIAGHNILNIPNNLNVTIFWYMPSCNLYVNLRFGGTNHLHLQGRDRDE